MKSSSENILIIFVKYPKPGFVKTRLAEDLGRESSVLLYRRFAELIIQRTSSDEYRQAVFYTPKNKESKVREWLGQELSLYLQQGKDLGQRMSNAFKLLFEENAKRIIIIGTDSPLIDKEVIHKAFKILENKQCVVGPCLDGGYCLLGLSFFCREIFKNISWGRETVFEETLEVVRKSNLSLVVLEENFDVDNKKDLQLLFRKLKKVHNKEFKNLKDELGFALNMTKVEKVHE